MFLAHVTSCKRIDELMECIAKESPLNFCIIESRLCAVSADLQIHLRPPFNGINIFFLVPGNISIMKIKITF